MKTPRRRRTRSRVSQESKSHLRAKFRTQHHHREIYIKVTYSEELQSEEEPLRLTAGESTACTTNVWTYLESATYC